MVDIQIQGELKDAFSFPYEGYSDPIIWTDGTGLGRTHKYGNGYVTLFKVGILDSELQKPEHKKTLWVTMDYGKETSNGISLGEGTKISDPVSLDFRNDFSYDVQNHKFYAGNREITAGEILSKANKQHLKPTKMLSGLYLRSRLWFWRKFLPLTIKGFDWVLRMILLLISGEVTEGDVLRRLVSERFVRPDREASAATNNGHGVKFKEGQTMDFFGYKAKRWSVVFYCLLNFILIFVLIRCNIQLLVMKKMIGNDFAVLCYVVITFFLTESLIPMMLQGIIKKVPKLYGAIAFKTLKI